MSFCNFRLVAGNFFKTKNALQEQIHLHALVLRGVNIFIFLCQLTKNNNYQTF